MTSAPAMRLQAPGRPAARRRLWRVLALGAVAGPALFTAAWLILGWLSPGYTMWDIEVESYSAVSQPISGLGLGPTGPWMNSAFVLTGVLSILGAVGIFNSIDELPARARRTCIVLLGLHGAGAVIDGVFTLEAIMPHLAGFLLAVSPMVGFVLIGRRLRTIPRWRGLATWLMWAGPLTLVLTVLYFATFDPEAAGANIGVAGLTQRLLVLELHGTLAATGWLAFRRAAS